MELLKSTVNSILNNSFSKDSLKILYSTDTENYIKIINLFIKGSLKIIYLMDGALQISMLDSLEMENMMVMEFIRSSKIQIEK